MINFLATYAVRTTVVRVIVAAAVITGVVVMRAIVPATIRPVVIRATEVEMIVIRISNVDAEVPPSTTGIDGAIEIIGSQEATVLRVAQHPAQIIIAHIQRLVIVVQCPLITAHHLVHQVAYRGDKVIVYLVSIVVLSGIHVQLMRHFIGQEASLFPNPAIAHRRHTCAAHGNHPDGKKK